LQINVIGGDVVLERLELKTEALANLELPIEVITEDKYQTVVADLHWG